MTTWNFLIWLDQLGEREFGFSKKKLKITNVNRKKRQQSETSNFFKTTKPVKTTKTNSFLKNMIKML